MPLALAVLLAFLLIPPAAMLERAGLRRGASVAIVVLVVLVGLGAFGYALSRQFTDLATHMPQYSASIRTKLAALRGARRGALTQIEETVKQAGHDLNKQEMAAHPPAIDAPGPVRKDVQPVVVLPTPPDDAELLRATWQPFAKPFATALTVLVLTIFILAQQEDLRSRLIRVGGPERVAMMARILDEAGQRIRRFLFSQSLINGAFGVLIALGFLLIGIPYALLWGVTAAVLRFVPYLGTTIAMVLATGLTLVQADGWARPIETLVLFWVAGLIAYVLDPIVNGTRTGTSSFALLFAAIFWTWLWGPVGLLLSTPITVCLLAVGKHVPGMEYLVVLLADEPTPVAADASSQKAPPQINRALQGLDVATSS